MRNVRRTALAIGISLLLSTVTTRSVEGSPATNAKVRVVSSKLEDGRWIRSKRKCSVGGYLQKKSLVVLTVGACFMGVVVESEGHPIPFSNIALYQKDILLDGTISDVNGAFIFSQLQDGVYSVVVSYVGYKTTYMRDVTINRETIVSVIIRLKTGLQISEVVCSAVRPYCIKQCGAGCICECCMPMEVPLKNTKGQTHGPLMVVDTVIFMPKESWRFLEKVRSSKEVIKEKCPGSSVALSRSITQRGIPPEQVAAKRPL